LAKVGKKPRSVWVCSLKTTLLPLSARARTSWWRISPVT
jgi:hypothetical protein